MASIRRRKTGPSFLLQFNAETFEAIVRYLYTNCCEITLDNVDSAKALARSCALPHLIDLIEKKKIEIDEWRE